MHACVCVYVCVCVCVCMNCKHYSLDTLDIHIAKTDGLYMYTLPAVNSSFNSLHLW